MGRELSDSRKENEFSEKTKLASEITLLERAAIWE